MSDTNDLMLGVIAEAMQRDQGGDPALKEVVGQLNPFDLWTIVEGVATVVRNHEGARQR